MKSAWDKHGAAYDDAITPFSMRVAEDALRIAGVSSGMRLLDIAAGGGAVSIPAARLGANVLATDFSPVMVELLQKKAHELGLSNLQVKVMDGTALALEDDSFDMTCSQLGIMLFPDRHAGLLEMARVTKPEGKGVMVVFGPLEKVQIFALFFEALRAVAPDFAPPKDLPLFSLQDPDDLTREMEAAGFRDVAVQTVQHTLEVGSGGHLFDLLLAAAPPVAGMLQQFSDEQQAAVRTKLDALLNREFGDGPKQLSAVFNVGVGLK